ncbi:class I SAM-dependent methyltransferase [Nocardia crassostreae]|uniref:class I SAM-dependent methyltransferase n=1 Tax=Nocardia crassostreae TaxID=53428 RepID=UPI000831BF50|nr:class I SAM-dependent methyltransferase [Nocardia crassostreae]
MAYEHALAYVLGLEGAALLRAFAGEHDRAFTEARIEEIRKILEDGTIGAAGVDVDHVDVAEGYGIWAADYDRPDNPAFDYDGSIVRAVAGSVLAGVALDVACGTGRVASLLADCGHAVIGVDQMPEMLDIARKRLPDGDFRIGTIDRVPVGDSAVDIATCSLALSHVADLRPAFAEFARVLRPGGHLVVADVHPEQVARTHVPTVHRADGTPARVRSYQHRTGDYLRAALSAGFEPRSCEEPVAAAAANSGVPMMILWHFTRQGGR